MTHLIARFMVILLSLFAASVLLVHAQPHDDRNVSNLLLNDSCSLPCFMGIQPGITLADDAVKLLKKHAWVQNIEVRYTDFGQSINTFWGYIYWQWKPGSPLWTHTPSYTLGSHDSYLRILDGRVNEIAFSTSLSLGEVVLSINHTRTYILDRPDRYGSQPYPVLQHFYYPDVGLVFGSISRCPALNPDWHQDTIVTLWSTDFFASFMRVLPLNFPSLSQARLIARLQCK